MRGPPRKNGSKVPILAEVIAKLVQRGAIRFNRIFSRIDPVVLLIHLNRLTEFHGVSPFVVVGRLQIDAYYERNVRYPFSRVQESWLALEFEDLWQVALRLSVTNYRRFEVLILLDIRNSVTHSPLDALSRISLGAALFYIRNGNINMVADVLMSTFREIS
jgi:hypothetical protein